MGRPDDCKHEYGIDLDNNIPTIEYDAVILAVAHDKLMILI